MANLKLISIIKLEGIIKLKSGMHIGSGDTEMHIGGSDNPVIKHPHTFEPYIPGSSIKGKVRSLLEYKSGLVMDAKESGGLITYKLYKKLENNKKNLAEAILKIFGCGASDIDEEVNFGPTRASFGDCYLNKEWKEDAIKNKWVLTEVKSENRIDRIKGTAEHPRFIERVPEGAEFNFNISFKEFEGDNNTLFNQLLEGLRLLEMDAIGGSTSRGYGRIIFTKLLKDNKDYLAEFRKSNI